jgi:hypothetical protein
MFQLGGLILGCGVGAGLGWVATRVFTRPIAQDASAAFAGWLAGSVIAAAAELAALMSDSSSGLGAVSFGLSDVGLYTLPVAALLTAAAHAVRRRVRRVADVPVVVGGLGALLGAVFVTTSVVAAQASQTGLTAWGTSTTGLRVGMSADPTNQPATQVQFKVVLENTGTSGFMINLGQMLGKGAMLPEAVRLTLTDPTGHARELKFFDRRYPGVAGRIDDYIVALRAGSSYAFATSLDQYWCPATKEFTLTLAPGRYQVSASFEGRGAEFTNLDTPGIALMNFWRGTVRSTTAEFQIAPRSSTPGDK